MDFVIDKSDQEEFRLKTLEFKVEQLQQKSDETIITNTNCGRVKGVKRRTIYDDSYYGFERIPYAQPPVGELRFRAPKPATQWRGVLDCTQYGGRPFQPDLIYGIPLGSEDCLFLNVYTNNVKPAKPRPVMVWIYGGGFVYGEATREWYGPDYFMKKDVILVTIQYRLGPLGFLSLNDPKLHIPGNAGLKDQVLALKWIKNNISNFGGNPDCVTVFGESAGGASTHLLMLSEQTRGLFHRAIAQSGVSLADWSNLDCAKNTIPLVEKLGYSGGKKERDILKFLLECDAAQLTAAAHKLTDELMAFGPTIESYVTPHTFITKSPFDLIENAWSNNIPFMLGGTSNEGIFFKQLAIQAPGMVDFSMDTCVNFVPRNVAPNRESPECLEKGLVLRRTHVAGEKPTPDEFCDIFSFSYFWHPIGSTIEARLKYARKSPTYLYRFDFDSEELINPYRIVRQGRGLSGVAHADELSYLFSNVLSRRMRLNSREYRTIERMVGLWTKFAETGNPNSDKIDGMKKIKWHPVRKENTWKCLNISDNLEFKDLPEMPKLKKWQSLYGGTETNEPISEVVDISAYVKSSL